VSFVPGHRGPGLSERDLGPDPVARLGIWLDEARTAGVVFAEAAALATADERGVPAVRHVLVKGVDERGLMFFTNHESRKARHLAENPHAAIAFLWRELDRQICVTGSVDRIPEAEAEAYFRTRPREARIGAWASQQSRPVASREDLEAGFLEMRSRFPGEDIPLPPHWGGYRLVPDVIEFWRGREHRLHDRLRYTLAAEGWHVERLWP
jgi:pyridoxamine 5'-phosphate oxidase